MPGVEGAWRDRSSVDPAEIRVRTAPWWLPHIRSGRYSAIALPWGIYVQAAVLERDASARAALIVHELVHIEQWRRVGVVRFSRRYLWEYARARAAGADARTAYYELSSEVEARRVAAAVLGEA